MITSLIVPVYNAERYIVDCLDSICRMTVPPDQVIVVDDRSTDGSLEVIQRYVVAHPRMPIDMVQLERRAGVSVARNRGVAVARGDFISFVDADDTVMPAMLEILSEAACQSDDIDFVLARHIVIREDGHAVVEAKTPARRRTVTGVEAFISMCRGELASSVCFGIIRRSVLLDHQFRPGVRFEDFIFLAEALPKARRIALVDVPVYRYHRRLGTETGALNPSVRDLMAGLGCAEDSLGCVSDTSLANYLKARLRLNLNLAMAHQAFAFGDHSDLSTSIVTESRTAMDWPAIIQMLRCGDSLLAVRATVFRCAPSLYGMTFRRARAVRWGLVNWSSRRPLRPLHFRA